MLQDRNFFFPGVLLLAFLGSSLVTTAGAAGKSADGKIGMPIADLSLTDTSGQHRRLHELQGKKATVVVFLSFECPVSKSYSGPLVDLARAHPDVAFLGIACNEDGTPADIASQAREFKLSFPVFVDRGHAAADAFDARITPEAFLLDRDLVVRYRGRIDNSYAARLRKNRQTTEHDLQKAVDELLAGRPVSVPVTRAVGCAIPREEPARTGRGKTTFYRDVLPILQSRCQTCHRPGEVGPFALMTYHQAVNWADDIKGFTQDRRMPPWKPVDGPAFHGERKLTDREMATLAEWVDNGTPEGDPGRAPPPRRFSEGWQLGKPDLVVTAAEDFHVAATGKDAFRCFVLPTHLTEDRYVVAVEVRPGNPRVVHHALLAIDARGEGRKLEAAERRRPKKAAEPDHGPGYPVEMGFGFLPQGGMGGWAPGQMASFLPEGSGYFLPKGADVVIQVHYHRDGKPEKDRCSVGLYLAKKPVQKRFRSLTLPGRFVVIGAGQKHFRVEGKMWVDRDCTLYTVMPHMHMLGREIKVTMKPPQGKPLTLVAIKDWDYNWQETYRFASPIAVKAGTEFAVEAFYDNSEDNPSNPFSPPRDVFFGQQTTNEMCFVFLGVTPDRGGRLRGRLRPLRSAAAGR